MLIRGLANTMIPAIRLNEELKLAKLLMNDDKLEDKKYLAFLEFLTSQHFLPPPGADIKELSATLIESFGLHDILDWELTNARRFSDMTFQPLTLEGKIHPDWKKIQNEMIKNGWVSDELIIIRESFNHFKIVEWKEPLKKQSLFLFLRCIEKYIVWTSVSGNWENRFAERFFTINNIPVRNLSHAPYKKRKSASYHKFQTDLRMMNSKLDNVYKCSDETLKQLFS